MEILKHRVLTIEQNDPKYGLEIDIRDNGSNLVLSHDVPNSECVKLSDFLKKVSKNQLLSINLKSVEIENQLKKILDKNNITNYFTFDWPVPSLLKAINSKLITAFRLSEYETQIFSECKWVWLDSFHNIWFDDSLITSLHKQGFKIAIVSPELHQRKSEMKKIKNMVNFDLVDAICTDYPDYWIDDKSNNL